MEGVPMFSAGAGLEWQWASCDYAANIASALRSSICSRLMTACVSSHQEVGQLDADAESKDGDVEELRILAESRSGMRLALSVSDEHDVRALEPTVPTLA